MAPKRSIGATHPLVGPSEKNLEEQEKNRETWRKGVFPLVKPDSQLARRSHSKKRETRVDSACLTCVCVSQPRNMQMRQGSVRVAQVVVNIHAAGTCWNVCCIHMLSSSRTRPACAGACCLYSLGKGPVSKNVSARGVALPIVRPVDHGRFFAPSLIDWLQSLQFAPCFVFEAAWHSGCVDNCEQFRWKGNLDWLWFEFRLTYGLHNKYYPPKMTLIITCTEFLSGIRICITNKDRCNY